MRRFLLATTACTTLAILVSGCPAKEEKKEDESPETLTISPVDPSVLVGDSLQLTATAHYADGTTRDVTEDAIWTSEVPAIATVDEDGVVLTLTSGESDISAAYDLRIAEIELSVVPPFLESEPNGDAASADDFTDAAAFQGTCDFATDEFDYFTATVPAGTLTATITWNEGAYPQDLDLVLLDATEALLVADADVPPGDSPATVTSNLGMATNTVFVVVDCFDTDAPTAYSGTLVHP